MKRSDINRYIKETIEWLEYKDMPLPPFAYWDEKTWKQNYHKVEEIIDNMLGWDVTDFGLGDFDKYGLITFTFRNGNFHQKDKYPKPYAEKMLVVQEGQELPFHFHWYKMEDIINRGGGNLKIQLYNSDENEEFADTDVTVSIDGQNKTVPAGSYITLRPGESITLLPYQYHRWIGESGPILLFEVSTTNDDFTDNRFYDELPRIPEVIEDTEKDFLIFNDYKLFEK